jgi:hypothetical protein
MAKKVIEILCDAECSQYNPAGRMSTSDRRLYLKLKQSTENVKVKADVFSELLLHALAVKCKMSLLTISFTSENTERNLTKFGQV